MESVLAALTGLIAGWLLTKSDGFMPDSYMEFAGNAVAGSETVSSLVYALPMSPAAAETVHVWLIIAALTVVPAMCIGALAIAVYMWARNARLIVYSSLVAPLFMAGMGLYYKFQLAKSDPLLARYFWNNAESNIQGYIFSVSIFILAFLVLKQLVRTWSLRNSHNQ